MSVTPMKLLLDHRPKSYDHRLVTSDDGVLNVLVRPGVGTSDEDLRAIAGGIGRAMRRNLRCTTRVWRGDGELFEDKPEAVFKAAKPRDS